MQGYDISIIRKKQSYTRRRKNMIVDGKGNLFENRRNGNERRKNKADATGGRRVAEVDRRKENQQETKKRKKA